MSKSTQEIVAKALWADGNNRIGHRPWATVKNAYMAEAGHAIAALVGNGFVIVPRVALENTRYIVRSVFGHADYTRALGSCSAAIELLNEALQTSEATS